MKATHLFMIFLLKSLFVFSQEKQDMLSFRNEIMPISDSSFFKTDGYYNWGGSIIKDENGVYHLFYSRWKKEYKFSGWLVLSEIAHATASSPVGPWKYRETVLKGRGKGYWDAFTAHNPKIKFFNGTYYLYYISTNYGHKKFTHGDLVEVAQNGLKSPDWMPLRNNQRTGVAFSSSLTGPWKRLDKPIIEPSGPITTLTVNPAITRGGDGRYYLIVKGDKPHTTKFIRNQAIAIAATPTGPFVMQPKAVIDYLDTEDMSLWYDSKRKHYYAIFHSTKGFIGFVTSRDGIHWEQPQDYYLMPKKLKTIDGSWFIPDAMERPFVYVEKNEPKALCFAIKEGDNSCLVFVRVGDLTDD